MLVATATVLHRVYTFDQTLVVTAWTGIAITAALAVFSVYHCFTDSLLAHSALFGKSQLHVGNKSKPYRSFEIRCHDMCRWYSNTLNNRR
jgi:dihydroceramidase